MKACTILAICLSIVISGWAMSIPEYADGTDMKYFLVESEPGVYQVEDLVNVELDLRASASDIIYYFFSKGNPTKGTKIFSNNVGALTKTEFNAEKETLFIVHGWKNNNESAVNQDIRQSILSRHDINVFVVDWGAIAGKNYASAQLSVTNVGKFVADFIRSLVSTFHVGLDKVAFVGHSLGAHISGNAGAALKGQVHHIVGLDPAFPFFSIKNINNRLDPSDARFVQVIHTNGGLLGFKDSIGHSDFFPNGGSSQPGCGRDLTGSCAHSRSYLYYAESVRTANNLFRSTLCTSYSTFNSGSCKSNHQAVMGGFNIDSTRGNFYLNTNSQSPFARG